MATSTALASFCPETQPSLESEEWTSQSIVASIEALPQQEWSGPWNWRNAEEEALLEWCNTAQQECTSQQPESACHLSPIPDEHMKRFLLLKNKIIDTHKLIRRYQDKEKTLKTATEKLVEAQASNTALRSELLLQHELNSSLSDQLNNARKQLEETVEATSHQKILIEQLSAKLEETKAEKDLMLHSKTGKMAELDRLQKEFNLYKIKHPEYRDPVHKFNHMKCDVVSLSSDPLSHHSAAKSTSKTSKLCASPLRDQIDQNCSVMDDDDDEEEEEEDTGKEEIVEEKDARKEMIDEDDDDDDDWCSDEEDMLANMLCEDVPLSLTYSSPKCFENIEDESVGETANSDGCTQEHTVPPLDSCVEIVNIRNDQMHSEEAHKLRGSQKRPQQDCSPLPSHSKRVRLATSPTPPPLPSLSPTPPLSPVLPCLGHEKPAPVVSLSITEQAEADTATSVESDSDSMDCLWHLPRFGRLQTVSPLPPSPLSPLSFFQPLFATLSPIPPSPNRATISPLPISPSRDDLHSPSLPQFSSQAPSGLCVHPTPLTPSVSASPIISPPPQRLKRSLSSSFSPPTKLTTMELHSPSQPVPPPSLNETPTLPTFQTSSDYEVTPLQLPIKALVTPSPTLEPVAPSSLHSSDSQSLPGITINNSSVEHHSQAEEEKEEGELVESPQPPVSLPSSPLLIHEASPSHLPCPDSPCSLSILDSLVNQQQQQEGELVRSSPLFMPAPSSLLCPDSPSSLSIVVMDSSVQQQQQQQQYQLEEEPVHTCITDQDIDSSVRQQQPEEELILSSDPDTLPSLCIFDSSVQNQQSQQMDEEMEVLVQPLEPTEVSQSVGYSNPVPPPAAKRPSYSKLDKATGQELKAGSSRSSSSSTSPVLSSPPTKFPCVPISQPLPPSQREVHAALRSPHPLPVWLTASLVAVQDATNHSITKTNKKKKKKKVSRSMNRLKTQSPANYALSSLSRLMDGLITVPIATTMFSDPANAPCPVVIAKTIVTYLCEQYHPRFESVLSLCWDKCLAVSRRLINPLDSSYIPPLLKPECILLSLLVTIALTNPKMGNLLPELTNALKEAIFSKASSAGFHHLCACCRVFAALCRQQNDIEQIQFVACELLLKSMASNNLPTVTALASIWPRAFARNHAAPPVQVGDQLKTEGVDMQPLSLTLEVVMIDAARKKKELQDKGPVSNLKKLCQWQQLPAQAVGKLTQCLVEILVSSKHVFIDAPSTLTPRPSKHAYAVVLALRVLSCSQGWAWTNDTLIRGHLWPLLQQWNRSPPSVRDSTIVCITRLIGFTAQIGVAEDPNSSSIQQLQKVFISLLQKEKIKKVSLCVQLAVADALIDLSPSHSSSLTTSTISQWITQLCQEGIATASAMAQLYGPRLQQIKH